MKKRLFFILMIIFLFGMKNVSATTLDCSVTLRKGNEGNDVLNLQRKLNELEGCGLKEDGNFGSGTKNCVENYQRHHNLVRDGVVGKTTCNMMMGNISVIHNYHDDGQKRGIITVSKANVRSKASTNSSVLVTTELGNVVKIVDSNKNWYKIKINSNEYGYIRKDLVAQDCIVVDISSQKLYFIDNGKLSWSTRVVTGNKGNHDTPVGSYKLEMSNMDTERTLRGTNDNGKPYTSYVDYWMPFIPERGIGFHDASWRTLDQFNNETFKHRGSHACVNMLNDAAKYLYNSIQKDMNVVVRD